MNTAWWKQYDWLFVGSILLLITFSLVMLLSITIGTEQPYARNQSFFAIAGLCAFIVISRLPYLWLIQMAPIFYGICLILLVAVAAFAQVTRGAASWIDLGFFSLQPSEFMKIAMILSLAYIYIRYGSKLYNGSRLLLTYAAVLLLPLTLILLQPDFGTALVIVSAWLGCVWMSPINKRLLTSLAVGVVALLGLSWGFLAPYQQQRVMTFINPTADPLGHGYNVLQSMIAVGSGGWFGQGWGRGTQSHLNFLPEHHTDFIFASLSEELGFVGAMCVLLLYGVIFWRGLRVIWQSDSVEEGLIVGGILTMLLVQTGINVAMNIGLAPVTGIPLPLVSYGGSSLLMTMVALGVIHSIYHHQAINSRQII